jgi:hypothetical protein
MTQPVKRTPKKGPGPQAVRTPAKKKVIEPGDPNFDWRALYKDGTSLFRFRSQDGFVVVLPSYDDPGEGEVFGLMLLNKSESDLLVYVMRQHIIDHAKDAESLLQVTFRALQRMKAPGVIEELLKAWPEASGKELGKS